MHVQYQDHQPKIGIIARSERDYVTMKDLLDNRVECMIPDLGRCTFAVIPSRESRYGYEYGSHSVLLVLAGEGKEAAKLCAQSVRRTFASIEDIVRVGLKEAVLDISAQESRLGVRVLGTSQALGEVRAFSERGVIRWNYFKRLMRRREHSLWRWQEAEVRPSGWSRLSRRSKQIWAPAILILGMTWTAASALVVRELGSACGANIGVAGIGGTFVVDACHTGYSPDGPMAPICGGTFFPANSAALERKVQLVHARREYSAGTRITASLANGLVYQQGLDRLSYSVTLGAIPLALLGIIPFAGARFMTPHGGRFQFWLERAAWILGGAMAVIALGASAMGILLSVVYGWQEDGLSLGPTRAGDEILIEWRDNRIDLHQHRGLSGGPR
jgi:hypothetical protein